MSLRRQSSASRTRLIGVQELEPRIALSWYDSANPTDVNDSGETTPFDALLVINELDLRNFSDPDTGKLDDIPNPPWTLDVNNDTLATPLDALLVINALPSSNTLFAPVTPGPFDAPGLMGIRTDLVAGAPPITRTHLDGDIDYAGYSNPPTYGPHHGFDPLGIDINPGITPRPTGIYTTEQPAEDLIHNMEHGHVWISYRPDLISASDLAVLEQIVRNGSPNPNGSGVGVVLTPRAANDTMIALASWAHLLTLDTFDPATIRTFVETNRGHSPEGFITP